MNKRKYSNFTGSFFQESYKCQLFFNVPLLFEALFSLLLSCVTKCCFHCSPTTIICLSTVKKTASQSSRNFYTEENETLGSFRNRKTKSGTGRQNREQISVSGKGLEFQATVEFNAGMGIWNQNRTYATGGARE